MFSALQDPVSWGEVASFNMLEVGSPPRRFPGLQQERTIESSIGHTVNSAAALSGQEKNCPPFLLGGVTSLTPISSSKPPQISVWRKRRKEREEMSPLCDRTGTPFMENISNSPKKTPTKSLPFTPLRVNETLFSIPLFSFTDSSESCNWSCS